MRFSTRFFRRTAGRLAWRALPALAVLLPGWVAQAQTPTPLPQLGRARLSDVVAALTVEEKIQLVLGMGMKNSSFPNGQPPPPGVLPAMDPIDAATPDKVSGQAGSTHAVPRLGIPSVALADGPAGVRINATRPNDTKTYYATAFPVATLLASSWDTTLVRQLGVAFGSEAQAYGVDVLLAPGLNIHRNPLGGRNFEYYSEDPVVSGAVAAALVRGVQQNGVGTSLKHLAANNQEFNRMQLDSHISERALREIYLRSFQLALQQCQPWTIMSSYNKINGTYTSESPDLLTTLLRREWGFQGLVMSDWFGGQSAVAQLAAGNDLLMPGTIAQRQQLQAALQQGTLTRQQLDVSVRRVLELVLRSATFRNLPFSNQPNLPAHAAVARRAATESMVLLRNTGRALPLLAGQRVALFGNSAYRLITGGTGSGEVNTGPVPQLPQRLTEVGFGVEAPLQSRYEQYLQAEQAKQSAPRALFTPAPVIPEMPFDAAAVQQQARTAAVAVLVLGRSAGEGADRREQDDFTLRPAERTLLLQLSAAFHAQGKKVVVVLNVGGAVETASWRDQADAVLLAGQPGQEGAAALADLLAGRANPSGKLASTFPVRYADVPFAAEFPGRTLAGTAAAGAITGQPAENDYREGIYVGYRYFNTFGVQPAYAFGHGLSYTTFGYGPLKLSTPTFAGQLTATLTVTNTGPVAGKEVVQLYLSAPAGQLPKPESELKAFAKTRLLAPGQSQTLTFTLTPAALASFDTRRSAWVADAGTYTVQAAASSRDVRQRATFRLPVAQVVSQSQPLLVPRAPVAELPPPKKP
jgi:beta-glucosidase